MLLIVTNKSDYTADFLIVELIRLGVEYARFNTEDFPRSTRISIDINNQKISGEIVIHGNAVKLEDIHDVWYRRPITSELSNDISDAAAREFIITESRATLDALWKLLACSWVSHPDKLRVAEIKPFQLAVAARLGFIVPRTVITNNPNTAQAFYVSYPGGIIYKPQRRAQIIRENTTSLIYTNIIKDSHAQNFDRVQFAPVLLQPYINKAIELRVTVVGSKVFTVALHSQELENAREDWRRAESFEIKHVPFRLPDNIADRCINLVKTLEISFGAIDLILTPDGDYVFLEINPNGQWAWIEQLVPELKIRDALIGLLNSQGNY